jgi:Cache 3/Cache 2 fusion domain
VGTLTLAGLPQRRKAMNLKQIAIRISIFAYFIAAVVLLTGVVQVQAQDAKVKTAMELLESMANELGPPKLEGTDVVAGRQVPAIYFGSTKMNNNFDLVDDVVKRAEGTATIFVKSGDEYVRVSTNVKMDDGTRAVGTILDPKGKAIESVRRNEAFYGDVDILGKPYITGYKPIRDSLQNVIGIYYVGYLK